MWNVTLFENQLLNYSSPFLLQFLIHWTQNFSFLIDNFIINENQGIYKNLQKNFK